MSSLNILFVVRSVFNYAVLLVMLAIALPLLAYLATSADYSHDSQRTDLNLAGCYSLITSMKVNMFFSVHTYLVVVLYLSLLSLASKNLYTGKQRLNKLAQLHI